MYLAHYGLNLPPFGITPNPDFFYSGNQRGEILDALLYAVTHGEGIIKVTGEVGSGKTMLCRMLERALPDNVVPIYLVNPTLSREEVGYAIAGELGLDAAGRRPDEVIRLLQNDLIAKHVEGKQVVLLVEEAQAMPLDTLEEIRLFSNLETSHHKLLQIVLFGQPELDESLNLPRMRQLKERITHSFKVPPLAPTLLPEFLMFRMRAAGYRGPNVFTQGAMALIASVSEGIVRRVSILADKALLAAFADNTHSITAKHVKAAVLDSQFSYSAGKRRKRNLIAGAAVGAAVLLAVLLWTLTQRPLPGKFMPTPPSAAAPVVVAAAPVAPGAPADAPVAPATLGQQQLQQSRVWLAQQAPARYTLQLALADTDPRKLERQLRKLHDEVGLTNLHVYPTRVNGEARFGIVYASYAARAEALAMKQQLAEEWGYQPQLRTVAGLREEIRRTDSDTLWPK
ncbi:MAG TPA: AAA family ATPase [Telluria sp.]|jgi:type II secretory pathway predicted ATPase ExeA